MFDPAADTVFALLDESTTPDVSGFLTPTCQGNPVICAKLPTAGYEVQKGIRRLNVVRVFENVLLNLEGENADNGDQSFWKFRNETSSKTASKTTLCVPPFPNA